MSAKKSTAVNADLLVSTLLIVFTICFFFRTVFQGKAISKLCRLANWDSIFQSYTNSSTGNCDPSLVQLLLPNYFLVAKLWHSLTLPLWNPYSGCGVPLIGDIQASVFSPLRIALAISPTAQSYNLFLVLEVALAVVGFYLLARLLTIGRFASVFAAVSYAFSPFSLYYLELLSGTSQALLPMLFASFVYLARQANRRSIVLSTVAIASFVLSGHPESSLFGVAFGVLFYFAMGYYWHGLSQKLFWSLLSVGVLSFALSAPVLLPFVEYLSCGQSYKYGDSRAAFAPWQGLVLNLMQPCYGGASPFLGIVSVTLLPCSVFVKKSQRFIVALLIASATLCLLLITRVGLLDSLLSVRPFSYLITVYLIPVFLVFIALLAAFGLQSFLLASAAPRVALVTALSALVIPLFIFCTKIDLHAYNFDETLPGMQFQISAIILNACLIAAVLFAHKVGRRSLIILPLALLLNGISLAVQSKTSLSVQPSFDFNKTAVTDFLSSHSGRALSVIEHVLKPNSNIVYQVSSLRVHNPLLPARFCRFVQLCGADLDEFHNQSYNKLNELIDLASVKYVLTQFKPLPDRYKLVTTTSEGIAIYENPGALPQAYLATAVVLVSSEVEAIAALASKDFVAQRDVIVESVPLFLSSNSKIIPLSVSRPDNNQVIVNYQAPRPACLVLTDTFYPGWHATIDGSEAPVVKANLLFRAVFVPAGSHQVRFYYLPTVFVIGLSLAGLALLTMAAIMLRKAGPS